MKTKLFIFISICFLLGLVGCSKMQESATPDTHPQLSGKPVVLVSVRKAGHLDGIKKFTDNDSISSFVNALKKAEAVNSFPIPDNKDEYLITFGSANNTGKLIDIWLKTGEKSEITDVTEKGSNYILPAESTDVIQKLINSK